MTSSDGTAGASAAAPLPADETLAVALLLSLAGGYLDAFTWVLHDQVLANAQTANVVLFGVRAARGEWVEALRHLPPLVAFFVGAFVALQARARLGPAARRLGLLVEIAILAAVTLAHVHIPNVAGTLGISFAAALQTSLFTRVRGRPYSSVMTTGNLRSVAEALHAAWVTDGGAAKLGEAGLFALVTLTFGAGAALGAILAGRLGPHALWGPFVLLAVALAASARPPR
jgi:uncharacterized membrane protein YoaK (UPF0700 family)